MIGIHDYFKNITDDYLGKVFTKKNNKINTTKLYRKLINKAVQLKSVNNNKKRTMENNKKTEDNNLYIASWVRMNSKNELIHNNYGDDINFSFL